MVRRRWSVLLLVSLGVGASGSGRLSANSFAVEASGLAGSEYRLVANLDPVVGGAAWVKTQRPVGATHYTASFLFDPSGIQMTPGGASVRFMNLVDENVDGTEPYGGVISVGFLRPPATTVGP